MKTFIAYLLVAPFALVVMLSITQLLYNAFKKRDEESIAIVFITSIGLMAMVGMLLIA